MFTKQAMTQNFVTLLLALPTLLWVAAALVTRQPLFLEIALPSGDEAQIGADLEHFWFFLPGTAYLVVVTVVLFGFGLIGFVVVVYATLRRVLTGTAMRAAPLILGGGMASQFALAVADACDRASLAGQWPSFSMGRFGVLGFADWALFVLVLALMTLYTLAKVHKP